MAGGQVRSYAAELRIQLAAVGVDVPRWTSSRQRRALWRMPSTLPTAR